MADPAQSDDDFLKTYAGGVGQNGQPSNAPMSDDDFLKTYAGGVGVQQPPSGPAWDGILAAEKTAAGKILNAIGYGARDGWGSDPIGISKQTQQELANAGLLNDWKKGQDSSVKSFNEIMLRTVADPWDITMRSVNAAMGGMAGLYGEVSHGLDPDETMRGGSLHGTIGQQALQVIAAVPGAASELIHGVQEGALGPEFMGEEAFQGTALGAGDRIAALREQIGSEGVANAYRARSVGVVGEGEAGFYDAVPPTPEALAARADAAAEAGLEQPPAPVPPADIHELARRVDPETFAQYDALAEQKATLRDEIGRMAEERQNLPEVQDAQNRIETILGKVNNVEDRLTKVASERLADARADLERLTSTDTEDMAAARSKLMDADFAMRDLAVQVSDAYRQAADMLPEPVLEAGKPIVEGEKGEGAEGAKTEGEHVTAQGQPEMPKAVLAAAEEKAPAELTVPNVLGNETLGGEPVGEGANVVGEPAKTRSAGGPKTIEGTGELKTRGLAEGVEAKAIENGLIDTFGDLPEYRSLNMEDQAKLASDLIAKDPERAKAVAMGTRQAPKGLHPQAMYVAMENHAIAIGDIDTLRDLATQSKLVQATTTAAQTLRLTAERNKASPIGAIQEVQAAREAALTAKNIDIAAEKAKISAEVKSEMRKAATVKHEAWADFLSAIRCEI